MLSHRRCARGKVSGFGKNKIWQGETEMSTKTKILMDVITAAAAELAIGTAVFFALFVYFT